MAEAMKNHWLPVFQAAEDQTGELLAEAAQWSKRWDFCGSTVPGEAEVAEVIRRGRRMAPGPDGLPYSMWRGAGKVGARTMCMLTESFADGTPTPPSFNEAWLAVLPKGTAADDRGGECVRQAESLRPLLLKSTDSKIVAGTLARGMRPILKKEGHPTQRDFVAGRDLGRNVVELDTFAPQCRREISPCCCCAIWRRRFRR